MAGWGFSLDSSAGLISNISDQATSLTFQSGGQCSGRLCKDPGFESLFSQISFFIISSYQASAAVLIISVVCLEICNTWVGITAHGYHFGKVILAYFDITLNISSRFSVFCSTLNFENERIINKGFRSMIVIFLLQFLFIV